MRARFNSGLLRSFWLGLAFALAGMASAQGRFEIKGRLKVEGGSLDGCRLVMYKDGSKHRTLSSDLNRFSLELELGSEYVLSFEKNGFVTKKLLFNTKVPAAQAQGRFTPFEFVVSLFKQYDGVNTVVFNQPVGRIRFDDRIADFDYDTDYTKSIQSALAAAEAEVKVKQEEEASAAKNSEKQQERAGKEKAKAEAREAKEAEAKAREVAKAREREEEVRRQAEAEKLAQAPAPPAPKPVERPKPKPEPRPKPQPKHFATPMEGTDQRMASNPRMVTEKSPVEPAQAHVGHEPRPKFEPTPVTQVRHQDVIVEPNQVITVVRFEEGEVTTEYRKVIRKYSGTYYFKDGQSCSRIIYENEALAEVR